MPKIDVSKLQEGFGERFDLLKNLLAASGIEVLFYCGFRPCAEQAKLWRASRTSEQVHAKISELESSGFDFLAKVIRDVGPQFGETGRHLTNAIPGMSHHNYGQAADGVVMVVGKPDWAMAYGHLWDMYGRLAGHAGLEWAGAWKRFREYVHVQHRLFTGLLKEKPEDVKALLEDAGSL